MSWPDELERQLRTAGVPAARRRRIATEFQDHLACDESAVTRLGEPEAVARQFADELGTSFARQAGLVTFLALVPFGVLVGVLFLLAALNTANSDSALTLPLVLGTQIAFVGGTLALLRAWRYRREAVIPAGEARVLLRRAAFGLAGAGMTVAALTGLASESRLGVQSWMTPLAWGTVGLGSISVLIGGTTLVRGARLLPAADGEVRDLGFDLGVNLDSRTIAVATACLVALCIAVAGFAQADPIDGLVRGVGDGALCLACFGLLGRYLGLRRQPA